MYFNETHKETVINQALKLMSYGEDYSITPSESKELDKLIDLAWNWYGIDIVSLHADNMQNYYDHMKELEDIENEKYLEMVVSEMVEELKDPNFMPL